MDKADYIIASNLTKLRAAIAIVRDVLPQGHGDEDTRTAVLKDLGRMEWVYADLLGQRMNGVEP